MDVSNISISNIASGVFDTVKQGVLWFSHRVVDITKAGWDTGKDSLNVVASAIRWVWSTIQPFFSKIYTFLKSPVGIASVFACVAGFCVKKSDEVEDPAGKIAFSVIGLTGAFLAGIITGYTYLA